MFMPFSGSDMSQRFKQLSGGNTGITGGMFDQTPEIQAYKQQQMQRAGSQMPGGMGGGPPVVAPRPPGGMPTFQPGASAPPPPPMGMGGQASTLPSGGSFQPQSPMRSPGMLHLLMQRFQQRQRPQSPYGRLRQFPSQFGGMTRSLPRFPGGQQPQNVY